MLLCVCQFCVAYVVLANTYLPTLGKYENATNNLKYFIRTINRTII